MLSRSVTIAPIVLLIALVTAGVVTRESVVFAAAKTAVIAISTKANEQNFDKTKITVKAMQPVKLTFTNSSSKDTGLQHNWILVKAGTADQVAAAGIQAGADKGWIPDSPDILAHTKLLNSGESETLSFTAPSAGSYDFLCSFPGHAATMRGTFIVK